VIRVALLVLLVACGANEELEKKVTKLEEDVATLRKERQFLELKQVQLLKQLSELTSQVEELNKKAAPPSYARPVRRQPDAAKTYSIPIDGDIIDGAPDALVTVVEAYEYACPYCEKVRATIDQIKQRYGTDVRWVGKQLVVHPQTATAAGLAICAAAKRGRFAKLDEMLWEQGFKQRKFDDSNCWEASAGCPVIDGFARKAGLDVRQLHDDMASCKSWLRGNEELLRKFGAMATPTFFINGRYLAGAQPLDRFASLIDEELSKAKTRVAQGTPRTDYYQKAVVDEGKPELDP
jgi:protein-disulfide isomerase